MYRSSAENSETVARATPLLTVVMEWWRAPFATVLVPRQSAVVSAACLDSGSARSSSGTKYSVLHQYSVCDNWPVSTVLPYYL